VGQGRRSSVDDGGEIESDQQYPIATGWSPGGAGGAIPNGGGGGEGGGGEGGGGGGRQRRDEGRGPTLPRAPEALFQELGVAMAAWHHTARRPSVIPASDWWTARWGSQLTVIMGGFLDDVAIDDIDVNDADVAGRRRRIRRLELRSSPRRRWWQAPPVAANRVGRQR